MEALKIAAWFIAALVLIVIGYLAYSVVRGNREARAKLPDEADFLRNHETEREHRYRLMKAAYDAKFGAQTTTLEGK